MSVGGKRLVVVLLAAAWVSGVVLYHYGNVNQFMEGSLSHEMFGAFAWSLPALLAAWIALGWLRHQTKSEANSLQRQA